MDRWIVVRQAYGRTRYFSIVRAGIIESKEWTEDRNRAERFTLYSLAEYEAKTQNFINNGGGAHAVNALTDLT
jgi:hypothetical protein